MTNSEKGKLGEKFVINLLKKQGYKIIDKPENGCDIVASKRRKKIKVEVKTTSNLRGGIPDMHVTEFTEKEGKWYFVADFLYVVRLNEKNIPIQIDVLTRKEIDSFANSHSAVLRIRTSKLGRALHGGRIGKVEQI